jgi:hypothetical protein
VGLWLRVKGSGTKLWLRVKGSGIVVSGFTAQGKGIRNTSLRCMAYRGRDKGQ